MPFHPAPFHEISIQVEDPRAFANDLFRTLLEARPFFPGDTNITGTCIDEVLDRLEEMGATSAFDEV